MQNNTNNNSTKNELEIEVLTSLVRRVLKIEATFHGSEKLGYVGKYQGTLHNDDTPRLYDELSTSMEIHRITPLFRVEDGKHTIYLKQGIIEVKPSNPWINLALFLATLLTVLLTGALYSYDGPVGSNPIEDAGGILSLLSHGWPFAASMLGILLAHEFGHYLAARYHRTEVTLPYFLPFPGSFIGTLGAFIQIKKPPKNKRILMDIGIAGPLAGLFVTIPVLIYGLSTSKLDNLPSVLPVGLNFEGNSILYLILKYIVHGQWLPSPASFNGESPFIYWFRYFFTGAPLPIGGVDVALNSVAWAGWAGLLITAMNLIPIGQLDGGHLIFVLFGKKAKKIMPFVFGALLLMGLAWNGWWLWAVLIFLMGRSQAEPLDQITNLDPGRKRLAFIGLFVFILVFIPVPLTGVF